MKIFFAFGSIVGKSNSVTYIHSDPFKIGFVYEDLGSKYLAGIFLHLVLINIQKPCFDIFNIFTVYLNGKSVLIHLGKITDIALIGISAPDTGMSVIEFMCDAGYDAPLIQNRDNTVFIRI